MKILMRVVALAVVLAAVTVGVVFFSLAWLPAYVLFGDRGMERTMVIFEWIVVTAASPFNRWADA